MRAASVRLWRNIGALEKGRVWGTSSVQRYEGQVVLKSPLETFLALLRLTDLY